MIAVSTDGYVEGDLHVGDILLSHMTWKELIVGILGNNSFHWDYLIFY